MERDILKIPDPMERLAALEKAERQRRALSAAHAEMRALHHEAESQGKAVLFTSLLDFNLTTDEMRSVIANGTRDNEVDKPSTQ